MPAKTPRRRGIDRVVKVASDIKKKQFPAGNAGLKPLAKRPSNTGYIHSDPIKTRSKIETIKRRVRASLGARVRKTDRIDLHTGTGKGVLYASLTSTDTPGFRPSRWFRVADPKIIVALGKKKAV